jgi:hypothetical protein
LRCNRLLVLLPLLFPAAAYGFADATQFFADPQNPHGATFGAVAEGLYFTGAPRFASQTCADCHVYAPGRVGLRFGADPAALFTDGYTPGTTYALEVELVDEDAGTEYGGATCTSPPGPRDTFTFVPCNHNGFALEIDGADGTPLTGGFCARPPVNGVCPMPDPNGDEALVAPDGDAVFAAQPVDPTNPRLLLRNGARSWHFWWTAPANANGPLTFYAAAVDGNGGDGTVANDQDPWNDDTVQASVFVDQAGAPTVRQARAGCAVAGRGAPTSAWALALVLGALSYRRCRCRYDRWRRSRSWG